MVKQPQFGFFKLIGVFLVLPFLVGGSPTDCFIIGGFLIGLGLVSMTGMLD